MIKSMTGYGKAEMEIKGKKITAEVRSLNGKQLDLSVRIPPHYRSAEYEIRSEAARRLQRGKADITISVECAAGANTVTINQVAFTDYYNQLSAIAAACGIADTGYVISSILRLPEVVQNEASTLNEDEEKALVAVVKTAFDRIDEFRAQEGAILIKDILSRIDTIESLKNSVEPFETQRTENVKRRIRESLDNLGVDVDKNRLEQEMIYYIEKLDITEEKVRLSNHCKYFREVASGEEGAGRKLGFITQEIGREINTLGSKSNDSDMQKIVVRMKDELEKIKEQLLNIL